MAKGGSFERELSKLISLWLSNGDHDDWVWHTHGSGGRATIRKRKKKETSCNMFGDLKSESPESEYFFKVFSIEAKTGYGSSRKNKKNQQKRITQWSLLDIIDSMQQSPIFMQFWDQCSFDAHSSKREPILIFRRNSMQACITMRLDIFRAIEKRFGKYLFPKLILESTFDSTSLVIISLAQFFNHTPCSLSPAFVKRDIISTILKRNRRIANGS